MHVGILIAHLIGMGAEKCNLATAQRPFNFRMRRNLLHMRRTSSACGGSLLVYGDAPPHAEIKWASCGS